VDNADTLADLKRRFADAQRAEQEAWRRFEEAHAEFFRGGQIGDTGGRASTALRAGIAANRATRVAADAMIDRAKNDARERGWNID
jgi:hypothetical protein